MKPTTTYTAVLILGIVAIALLTAGIVMFASEDVPQDAQLAPTNEPGINYLTDPWYRPGDLVCAGPNGACVIVEAFDDATDEYTYRNAHVDLHAGTKEGGNVTGSIGRVVFQEKYNTKVTLHQ